MSGTDIDDRFVTLRDGPVVPAPAYLLLLDFERRGVFVRRETETVVVGPSHLLSDEDRAAVRRWKRHLLMLLDHCERPSLDAHLCTDTLAGPLARRTA